MVWRWVLGLAAVGLVLAGGAAWRDLGRIGAALESGATVVATARGPVEVARGGGPGPAVLVLHGAGGGHDQGRLLAEALAGPDVAWIAPSRFGYLRSAMPADGSTAAQADALAALLAALEIDRVGVLAMSGGAPPALQFAARHTDRTMALVLVAPAPYAPLGVEAQDTPLPIWVYDALFARDLPFWALWRVAPGWLESSFGVTVAQRAAANPEERAFVAGMVRGFLPVTARRAGLANEGAAIDPAATDPRGAISAPLLILHARDDPIAPFATATFTAEGVAGTELIAFDTGGHLLLGRHAAARARITAFWRAHLRPE